jgi:hypothetical protein
VRGSPDTIHTVREALFAHSSDVYASGAVKGQDRVSQADRSASRRELEHNLSAELDHDSEGVSPRNGLGNARRKASEDISRVPCTLNASNHDVGRDQGEAASTRSRSSGQGDYEDGGDEEPSAIEVERAHEAPGGAVQVKLVAEHTEGLEAAADNCGAEWRAQPSLRTPSG